jgi:addiction module RelE/StbE family toxin
MLEIEFTQQFEADLQIQVSQGKDPEPLKEIIEKLEKQLPLPKRCCDSLMINSRGRWNCLISFDWWLIYKCDGEKITFEQTGSTRYLFAD